MRPSRSLLRPAGGVRPNTARQRRRSASSASERMRAISAAIAAAVCPGWRMATRSADRRAGSAVASLPATIRYTRSPSVFSDSSLSPSFLRTTPAKNPRTECGCQPVRAHDGRDGGAARPAQQSQHPRLFRIRSRLVMAAIRLRAAFDRTLEADARLDGLAHVCAWTCQNSSQSCRRNSAPPPPKPRGGPRRWRGRGASRSGSLVRDHHTRSLCR